MRLTLPVLMMTLVVGFFVAGVIPRIALSPHSCYLPPYLRPLHQALPVESAAILFIAWVAGVLIVGWIIGDEKLTEREAP